LIVAFRYSGWPIPMVRVRTPGHPFKGEEIEAFTHLFRFLLALVLLLATIGVLQLGNILKRSHG
jgi:hypothetical protein